MTHLRYAAGMGPHPAPLSSATEADFADDTEGIEFEDLPGWIWTIYPAHSTEPMVAVGQSGNIEQACARAAEALAISGVFATVVGPRGEMLKGLKNTGGGVIWKSLHAED